MVHTFNPSTWKAETGQPGLHGDFQTSQDYIVKHYLQKTKQTEKVFCTVELTSDSLAFVFTFQQSKKGLYVKKLEQEYSSLPLKR